MKLLGIIPARIGSKRIPNKNIKILNGKPLIAWTVIEALKSRYISELVVSTDSYKILEISENYGIKSDGLLRDEKYAQDQSSTVDTIIYEIDKRNIIRKGFTHVMILQPTSPFRTHSDIDNAVELLIKKSAQSIISVSECQHPPQWSNQIDNSLSMNKFYKSLDSNRNSQSYEKSYNINGAIYLIDIEALLSKKAFILKNKSFAYVMNKDRSFDIDDSFDWLQAESYMNFLKHTRYKH